MTVDPGFTGESAAPRGGLRGFLTSIPGILTATAAVITALSGVYFAQGDSGTPGQTSITVQAAPIPEGTTQVEPESVATELDDAPVDEELAGLVDDCALGFTDACASLLDLLVEGCYQGYGIDCDALYVVSEVGSDYEAYGATCGGRFGWEYVGECSTL